MFLKLFIAMGLTWFLEIITWAIIKVGTGSIPEWLSIILIMTNVLQGIVVFVTFGLKPTIRKELKKKYTAFRGERKRADTISGAKTSINSKSGIED